MKASDLMELTNPVTDGICYCPVSERMKFLAPCKTKNALKTIKIPKCSRCGGTIKEEGEKIGANKKI